MDKTEYVLYFYMKMEIDSDSETWCF